MTERNLPIIKPAGDAPSLPPANLQMMFYRRPEDRPLSPTMAFRLIAIVIACAPAGGCGLSHWAHNGLRVGPNYHQPPVVLADDWLDRDDPGVLPGPPLHTDWWTELGDPVVDDLVRIAMDQNLTLREAGARVLQARASRAITAGNLFAQQQQAFADFTHIQESKTTALPPPIRAFDEWEVGFSASWEIDFWGKIRRAIDSADARLEASIADYDAVLVTLIAEVATAYVDIRTFERRLELARQNVEVQESSKDLSTARADEGKTGQLGVYLADANLRRTESTIPALETGRRQASNRLCTLLGIPPEDLAELLGKGIGIPEVRSEVAVGIPADLLRRRPDVRAAERLVAAQSEQIGVAVAELYPSISLNGEVYQASEDFGDLFRAASAAGSIGPSLRWNILNYGRIVNNVRLQDARLQELIAAYQSSVLAANQEVEDALVAFLRSQETVESLQANVKDLDESRKLLIILFEEGKIDFSPVFVIQGALRGAQDQLADAKGQVVLNLINVYRALGGGWEIRCPGFVPTGYTADGIPPAEPSEGESSTAPEVVPAPPPDDVQGVSHLPPETNDLRIPDNILRGRANP